jgi:FMN-dependent NADH-azoreductase
MSSLLSVVSSPRGDYSVSRALTAKFVDAWKSNHADGDVVTRDLCTTELPFVDLPWIAGAYTPAEQHSLEMAATLKLSNELVDELVAADHILIGTSMYNFSTPANLKAWIDQIVRVNRTFTSSYEGLLKGKKLTIILASMGVYTAGSPQAGYDAETSYLKQVLGFIGLTDVTVVMAGGTGGVNSGQITFEDLVAQYVPEVVAAAA